MVEVGDSGFRLHSPHILSVVRNTLIPPECLGVILRDTLTLSVQLAEIHLGQSVALARRAKVTLGRFRVVLGNSLALGVHVTQMAVGRVVPEFGCAPVPLERL